MKYWKIVIVALLAPACWQHSDVEKDSAEAELADEHNSQSPLAPDPFMGVEQEGRETEDALSVDCEGDETFFDTRSDLCWQTSPGTELMSYAAAVSHCSSSAAGGYDNWYLPDIYELITLLRGCVDGESMDGYSNCVAAEPDCVTPGCFAQDGCRICEEYAGPGAGGCYLDPAFESCGYAWSLNAAPMYPGAMPEHHWGLDFTTGEVKFSYDASSAAVLCVRRPFIND